MSKKLLSVIVALLLIAATLTVVACKELSVLDLYGDVSEAKTVVQQITVKNGDWEIAKETLTYNFTTGKVEIEKRTLNYPLEDETFVTTSETRDIQKGDGVAKLSEATLSNITSTNSSLKATVKNDRLFEVFGIDSQKVDGDAAIEMLAEEGRIVKLTVSYSSTNGNSVEIVTTYTY